MRDARENTERETSCNTVRHRGQVMVIDHVPADVGSVCWDVLPRPNTVRRIEAFIRPEPGEDGAPRQVPCRLSQTNP